MGYQRHSNESTAASAGAVTIDDVAALAMKIGAEIWGQEQFDMMMSPSGQPDESAPVTGKASASGKFTRNRDKKESA